MATITKRQVLLHLKLFARKKPVHTLRRFAIWILVAAVVGTFVGTVGSLFSLVLTFVTNFRVTHDWSIYFLPLGGVLIIWLYHLGHVDLPRGTNLVISSIRSEEQPPAVMAPLIFVSTAITHLVGGSVGREGAALQLGGSLGNSIGKLFHLGTRQRRVVIMCGMSAAFAALFGTPLAATVFALELTSVGVMYYSALVPCALSAIVASEISVQLFHIRPESFAVKQYIETMNPLNLLRVLLLAALCAALSILMCYTLHNAGKLFRKLFPNPYLRAAAGGAILLLLVWILDTRDYLGAGLPIIERAISQGETVGPAFLLKLVFTAVSLGCGYKGGEIVPAFFLGSTFGCLIGSLIGVPPSFAAALGLVTVFCGVTNCPLASLIIAFELFGFHNPAYFLIAVAVGYALSGYYSLYSAQKIVYDKLDAKFIDKPTM